MRAALAVGLAVAAAVVLARRRIDTVEVRGASMAPTLAPGDRLVVIRAAPRRGDVVLARDPRDPRRELIKRVATVGPDGVRLLGDNVAASADARLCGAIPPGAAEWRASLRYWPLARAGRLVRHEPTLASIHEGGEAACAFPEALIAGEAR